MRAALRCYLDNVSHNRQNIAEYFNENLIFIFDTETTSDIYQNLLFGSFMIVQRYPDGKISQQIGLFYDSDNVSTDELQILTRYSEANGIKLITKDEFVDVFLDRVYRRRAICAGFNLPFDISRIAIEWGISRRPKNGFSFKLKNNKFVPRIVVKHIDSKRSLISFTRPLSRNRKKNYRGCFVDLRTVAFALTNENHSLESACDLFKVEHRKQKAVEHGRISPEYIEYNVNDIKASCDLFFALEREFEKYTLQIPLNKLFSPASIGKAFLDSMGIKPFLEKNPGFSKEILGYVMTTYYGGRTEVHIRKTPTKVTYLDFTSMYPTCFVLIGLWRMLITSKIDVIEDNWFRQWLESASLDDLVKKENWSRLCGIALIDPHDDILPVRAKYGNKRVYKIGINRVTGKPLWFAYPDILASKMLTGKSPKILRALKFVLNGIQHGLRGIEVLGQRFDPAGGDFFKFLIEERFKLKEMLRNDAANSIVKNREHVAKIIANATSYGIFVQIDTEEKEEDVDLYGLERLRIRASKLEKLGKVFNPIVATLITSASRLILAMVEKLVGSEQFAYCDTDSVFVSPRMAKTVQDFFRSLNPYDYEIDMFKIEAADGRSLDNVFFYGISAKRYCLYEIDPIDDIKILKHSSHGLGQSILSLSTEDEKEFWKDILKHQYGFLKWEDIQDKYGGRFVARQLSITTPNVLGRFAEYNRAKNMKRMIKPYNFLAVGEGYRIDEQTGEAVIPMLPFTRDKRDLEIVPYKPFVDYKTGKIFEDDTHLFWKPLSELFLQYIQHNDQKYVGDVGVMQRRDVVIDDVEHVGKESNNLEESEVFGVQDEYYLRYEVKMDEQDVRNVVINLTEQQATKLGMSRSTFFYLKKKAREGEQIRLKRKTLNLLFL